MDNRRRIEKIINWTGSILTALLISVLLILSLCSSCQNNKSSLKTYRVKKGKNHFSPKIFDFNNRELNFEFELDASCLYDLKDVNNKTFVSKIIGLSDCNVIHHSRAGIYLGFQPVFNELGLHTGSFEIYSYWRNEGKFQFEVIDTIRANTRHTARLRIDKNYIWNFDGKVYIEKRVKKCNKGIHYRFGSYFGGTETAPHNMKLKLNIL